MAYIQPVLCQLDWLLVEYRVRLKVLVLTIKALSGQGLMYLRDCLLPYLLTRVLCSGESNLLVVPGPKDFWLFSTRDGAFLVLTPTWWNYLPNFIRILWDLV